ncbi:MAG: YfhO family protein [Clostridiales bacterium]|nr:YfhO family protein [Clostridiales bacterium]
MIEKQSLQVKQKKSFDVLPLISFAAMALLMVVIFAVTGITPFGSKSWLISDLAAQYAPALASYRDIFSGEGLSFFSFRLGMGKSIVGFFAYYLSSPLNLISFLFPKEKVSDAVSILILLKLSFAASFMTWLLDRKFSEKTKMSIPFGISYALCSFSLIFMFNIMWLDGFAILPLLILLVEDFRKDRRSWGKVTLVLVVLFASGYYIAYMVGVFSFLYMLCVMGYEGKLKTKDDAKTVGLFILSAGVAAMVCAALLVPAGLDTIRNGDNSASTAITLDPSFKLIDFIPNLFLVNLSDISTNLPYVFVNLTVLSLNVLFFLNETIPAKLRRLVALALGIFLMCFMFEPLNLIWHAFNSPDSLLYRYSFLVSFVMVLVAFYSFQKLKALCPIRFAQTAGILFALLTLGECFSQKEGGSVYFQTMIFVALILALLFGLTKEKWPESIRNLQKWGSAILVIVMLVEIVFLNPKLTLGSAVSMVQDKSIFEAECRDVIALSNSLDSTAFYRTESGTQLGDNLDPGAAAQYANYKSLSLFCSMANKQQQHFLKQMGYKLNFNYTELMHINCILPTDSLLGVRYIISKEENMYGLTKRAQAGQYYLYENPYAMPIAYLVSSDATAFDGYSLENETKQKDYFSFQERWLTSLTGQDASELYTCFKQEWEVYNGERSLTPAKTMVPASNVRRDGLNRENPAAASEALCYYVKNCDKALMVLRTSFVVEEESPLYLSVPAAMKACGMSVYVNGKQVYKEESDSYYSVIIDLGAYPVGTQCVVDIQTSEEIFACFEPVFAYCHTDVLEAQTSILRGTVKQVNVSKDQVTVDTDSSEEQFLMTTIPYEKGWTVKVDGVSVPVEVYQEAFVGVHLSSGAHHVEFTFAPPGMRIGVIISAVGVVLGLFFSLVLAKKPAPKKKKD